KGQEPGRSLVGVGPVAGVRELAGDAGERIDDGEDGEPPLPRCNLDGPPGKRPRDAGVAEGLRHLLGIISELLFHRLPDDGAKSVLPGVSLLDEALDDPPDVTEGLSDLAGVLAGELRHVDGVPDDVVLADGLEPEGRDSDRAFADLGVPDVEARGEGLAVDL